MDPRLLMLCASLISPIVTEYISGHYIHSQENDDSTNSDHYLHSQEHNSSNSSHYMHSQEEDASSNSGHYVHSQWDDGSGAHSNNGNIIHDSDAQETGHWESSGYGPGRNNANNNYNHNGVIIEDVENLGEYACEGQGLTTVGAGEYAEFQQLSKLSLSSNVITTIDDTAFCGTHIEDLNLSDNLLSDVPDLCCIAGTLTNLTLSYNNLYVLHGLGCLNALNFLDVSWNLMSIIDVDLLPPSLAKLVASGNPISSIESTSNDTTKNTEYLIAQQCNLTNVDILTVGYVPKYLDFSRNKLSWFPNFTQSMSSIIELNLSTNHIREVPVNLLSTLTQMTKFTLSSNILQMFPTPSRPLDSMLHLHLANNNISTIERSSICLYPNLRYIYLQGNILSSLPDINFLFPKIQTWNSARNTLEDASHGLQFLSKLKVLSIATNNLHSWPNLTGSTGQLKKLVLNSNNLFSIPYGSLDDAKVLQELDISHNEFTAFPNLTAITGSLRHLNLAYNFIKDIPQQHLGVFSSGPSIDVQSNQLQTLLNLCYHNVMYIQLVSRNIHTWFCCILLIWQQSPTQNLCHRLIIIHEMCVLHLYQATSNMDANRNIWLVLG